MIMNIFASSLCCLVLSGCSVSPELQGPLTVYALQRALIEGEKPGQSVELHLHSLRNTPKTRPYTIADALAGEDPAGYMSFPPEIEEAILLEVWKAGVPKQNYVPTAFVKTERTEEPDGSVVIGGPIDSRSKKEVGVYMIREMHRLGLNEYRLRWRCSRGFLNATGGTYFVKRSGKGWEEVPKDFTEGYIE